MKLGTLTKPLMLTCGVCLISWFVLRSFNKSSMIYNWANVPTKNINHKSFFIKNQSEIPQFNVSVNYPLHNKSPIGSFKRGELTKIELMLKPFESDVLPTQVFAYVTKDKIQFANRPLNPIEKTDHGYKYTSKLKTPNKSGKYKLTIVATFNLIESEKAPLVTSLPKQIYEGEINVD